MAKKKFYLVEADEESMDLYKDTLKANEKEEGFIAEVEVDKFNKVKFVEPGSDKRSEYKEED